MPIIRPSVNSEFISGWPHSVSCLAEMPVDVQRLRVERHVGEQHVVHLRHGAAQRVLVEVADDEVVEIDAAARVALDRGSGFGSCRSSRTPVRTGNPLTFHLP